MFFGHFLRTSKGNNEEIIQLWIRPCVLKECPYSTSKENIFDKKFLHCARTKFGVVYSEKKTTAEKKTLWTKTLGERHRFFLDDWNLYTVLNLVFNVFGTVCDFQSVNSNWILFSLKIIVVSNRPERTYRQPQVVKSFCPGFYSVKSNSWSSLCKQHYTLRHKRCWVVTIQHDEKSVSIFGLLWGKIRHRVACGMIYRLTSV